MADGLSSGENFLKTRACLFLQKLYDDSYDQTLKGE
jgi:hypothetical protein